MVASLVKMGRNRLCTVGDVASQANTLETRGASSALEGRDSAASLTPGYVPRGTGISDCQR